MTSNQNKFLVSQLVITFRLLLFLVLLILYTSIPLTSARNARNTASSNSIAVNKTLNNNSNNIYSNNNNLTESLVIMSNGTNITSVYNSFIEFKKMFGVEFPDDRRIAFISGDGELDHLDGDDKINFSTLYTLFTFYLLFMYMLTHCEDMH